MNAVLPCYVELLMVSEQSAFTLRIVQSGEASNCKGSTLEVLRSCFWCLTGCLTEA
jgi:hypothetical protein